MNGAHDLGGCHGLGVIDAEPESEEPVFHAEWERRAFALTLAMGMLGRWNIDEARFARERQHPQDYLANSYYENWLAGLETLLQEKQLADGATDSETLAGLRVPTPSDAKKILFSGGPTLLEDVAPSRYRVGDAVRVKKIQNSGHTRAPAYVQGVSGIIAAHYGTHVYPDANANGDRRGEHLYSVVFPATSLWGDEAQADEICVDLWEPYLEDLSP